MSRGGTPKNNLLPLTHLSIASNGDFSLVRGGAYEVQGVKPAIADGLRQRKLASRATKMSDRGASDIMPDLPENPLAWFGVCPPASLRRAQKQFQKGSWSRKCVVQFEKTGNILEYFLIVVVPKIQSSSRGCHRGCKHQAEAQWPSPRPTAESGLWYS